MPCLEALSNTSPAPFPVESCSPLPAASPPAYPCCTSAASFKLFPFCSASKREKKIKNKPSVQVQPITVLDTLTERTSKGYLCQRPTELEAREASELHTCLPTSRLQRTSRGAKSGCNGSTALREGVRQGASLTPTMSRCLPGKMHHCGMHVPLGYIRNEKPLINYLGWIHQLHNQLTRKHWWISSHTF